MIITRIEGDYLEANTFLIENNGQVLIIDSGANLQKVIKAVQGKKVLAILLTHAHFDHSCYCEAYAKEFGVKVYLHQRGKEILEDAKKNYSENFSLSHFENFVFLKNDGQLKLGDFDVEFYSTPGHSPCAICYRIDNQLFAGDTLFENSIGRTDLYGSSKEEMISSLEKLDKLKFAVCHSGHGEDSTFERQKRNIAVFLRFLKR